MLWVLAQATVVDPTSQLERLLASLQCYLWPASVDPQPGKRGPFTRHRCLRRPSRGDSVQLGDLLHTDLWL